MLMRALDRVACLGSLLIILGASTTACGGDDDRDEPTPSETASAAAQTSEGKASAESKPIATQTPLPGGSTQGQQPPRPGQRTPLAGVTPGARLTPPAEGTPVARAAQVPVEVAANPGAATATLRSVSVMAQQNRSGIVFEFDGPVPGYKVEFATSAAACGSGQPVTVPGTARIIVRFSPSVAHDESGRTTAPMTVAGSGAITEAKQTCDFEGVVSWVIGLPTQTPTGVVVMGNRLIITPRAQ